MGTSSPKGEGGLSPLDVAKLLFPDNDSSVIPGNPDVRLSGSGGVSSAAIVDLWVAKSLLTDDYLYDISLALLSQPLLGKHLKYIKDWRGQYPYIHTVENTIHTDILYTLNVKFWKAVDVHSRIDGLICFHTYGRVPLRQTFLTHTYIKDHF